MLRGLLDSLVANDANRDPRPACRHAMKFEPPELAGLPPIWLSQTKVPTLKMASRKVDSRQPCPSGTPLDENWERPEFDFHGRLRVSRLDATFNQRERKANPVTSQVDRSLSVGRLTWYRAFV